MCVFRPRERVRLSVRDGGCCSAFAATLLLSPAGIEAPQPLSDETAGALPDARALLRLAFY